MFHFFLLLFAPVCTFASKRRLFGVGHKLIQNWLFHSHCIWILEKKTTAANKNYNKNQVKQSFLHQEIHFPKRRRNKENIGRDLPMLWTKSWNRVANLSSVFYTFIDIFLKLFRDCVFRTVQFSAGMLLCNIFISQGPDSFSLLFNMYIDIVYLRFYTL